MGTENVTNITDRGFDLSYKAFENTGVFLGAMRKIYTCEALPSMKSTYRIKRLCETIEKELQTYMDLKTKIKPEEKEKITELHEMTVKVKWDKLSKEELECIKGVTPADMSAFEFVGDVSSFAN